MGNLEANVQKIREFTDNLYGEIFKDKVSVDKVMTSDGIRIKKIPYNSRHTLFEDPKDWDIHNYGDTWGERDTHFNIRLKVQIPESFRGKEVLFFLSTGADDIWNTDNPQMLIYIDGVRRCGMDMNHNSLTIFEKEDWEKGRDTLVDIAIYAYSNWADNTNNLEMEIATRNEQAQNLYFDLLVPLEILESLIATGDYDEEKALFIEKHLTKAITEFADYTEASEYLRKELYGKDLSDITVDSVGHTHIDVAWKWQIRQTKEKVIRSFSTVMELMRKYPDYIFMSSTPQMYEFVREEEPELFEEIKEKVKKGKFEPEGGMWLEADCNLTSGESLVRQILYGKRYFKDTFNVDSTILWLPDVFGYSAAMPQILKKSGIKSFMTTKLAWNDTNRFPYDLFFFKGIDGSKVLSYIITTCDYPKADEAMKEDNKILNYTYNGRQNASQIMGTHRAFREKDITNELLTVYGFGDGGGGTTWEMLEMDKRMELGLPMCPVTRKTTVKQFFDNLHETVKSREDQVPVWEGELYLEFHRGTYTSIGKNKKNNRKAEFVMSELETRKVFDFLTKGASYDRDTINEMWKTVMLNQFHDILPGSSIEEVYQDSDEQYKELFSKAKALLPDGSEGAGETEKISHITDTKDGSSHVFETKYYKVIIDEKGEIVSLYDKELARELRHQGAEPLNRLIAFKDVPKEYDCWNIDADFEDEFYDITDLQELSINSDSILVKRKFRDSIIEQRILFYEDSKRIDFKTHVDWHEHQILLKAAFPVDVDAKTINCEIQYGHLTRNVVRENKWDKAKFECCAHKWIDMTCEDGSYGVAILNDCKYGYDAKENLMRLTLLKSGIFPNPNADNGPADFTYSLYPHKGSFDEGGVIEEAYKLNYESHLFDYTTYLKARNAIIELIDSKGVFLEAVKLSEDGEDIIVRMYEGYGKEHKVKAKLLTGVSKDIEGVYFCDLLENPTDDGEISFNRDSREAAFDIKPFEIKTIRIAIE
ncbi:alpha-mannosidase [Butyrivibrio proteoclasticus]|uniref:alpha-mannosidase n=1 Tax=Butyrivibrio proteoclasticus TaxID=43305 RepID=UPI0006841AA2|nr:glycoside hydrolase family 38 C-terminal domain-containing protein [Butyrivibrio proteoclasticus]